jgi:hypothetical protein
MIDEDPRFPNRKKKKAEEPRHDNETPALDAPYLSGEKTAEEPLHFSSYKIIDPDSKRAVESPAEPEIFIPAFKAAPVEAAMPICGLRGCGSSPRIQSGFMPQSA